MKKALAALAATLSLCLIGSPSFAADSPKARLSADGRTTFKAPGAQTSVNKSSHAQLQADGLSVIYSTLNSDESNLYDCCAGWTISSPSALTAFRQSIGMPFTPSSDVDLRKVIVAVGWVTGANEVAVSLREDAGGMPGDVVKRAHPEDLNTFGDCCATTVIPSHPIHLTGGTQYWIVVRSNLDTWAAWNWNTIGASGTYAYQTGDDNWQLASDVLSAFAVLGN